MSGSATGTGGADNATSSRLTLAAKTRTPYAVSHRLSVTTSESASRRVPPQHSSNVMCHTPDASQVRMAGASTSSGSAPPSGRLNLLLPGTAEALSSGCLPAAIRPDRLTLDKGVRETGRTPLRCLRSLAAEMFSRNGVVLHSGGVLPPQCGDVTLRRKGIGEATVRPRGLVRA